MDQAQSTPQTAPHLAGAIILAIFVIVAFHFLGFHFVGSASGGFGR